VATDDLAELIDPDAHEPLAGPGWDAERARAAIVAIAAETERAFDPDTLWPPHPLDEADDEPPLERVTCIYLGASGVIWALDALERSGTIDTGRDWAGVAASLPDRYRDRPDFPDGLIPSLLFGEAGILLVAHALAPSRWQEERLLDAVRGNVSNPTAELFWGAPGTMLAAQVLHERTGDAVWVDAWNESADELWATWQDEVWWQEIRGRRSQTLGPAHGFVGNVVALARGDLLDGGRREELERRVVAVLSAHARRVGDCVQWPIALTPSRRPTTARTQWCHGAPGIVASVASLAPRDDELTALLVAGGELTWRAGPLRKGAGLCHGTAGNGYAFLKLFERTGDELWLERARAFAAHAIEQARVTTARNGRGRHSLWTGEPGTALYLQSCLDGTAAVPTLDAF